jgi:acyl-CoA synthetase (AMP-forming)/AMP-acid ligase II
VTGSAQSPHELLTRALERFPNAVIADGYGMTETVSGDIFVNLRTAPGKLGSVGRISHPMLYQRLRLVDPAGRDVGPGEAGEILVSGGKTFVAYWGDPAATTESLVDGWFRTGDVGKVDDDGYLFVVDRMKDMIKSGGENVGSLEVERVIQSFPEVRDVAVVGLPDPRWGEVPAAFVILNAGELVSAEEVRSRCRAQLARFKVPRQVAFIDELPRTASGKVRKGELRALAKQAADPGARG